jgi:hypothetical protein
MQVQTAPVSKISFQVIKDKNTPNDWRVEAIDSKSGDVFVAIFCGSLAQDRAIEYAEYKNTH